MYATFSTNLILFRLHHNGYLTEYTLLSYSTCNVLHFSLDFSLTVPNTTFSLQPSKPQRLQSVFLSCLCKPSVKLHSFF